MYTIIIIIVIMLYYTLYTISLYDIIIYDIIIYYIICIQSYDSTMRYDMIIFNMIIMPPPAAAGTLEGLGPELALSGGPEERARRTRHAMGCDVQTHAHAQVSLQNIFREQMGT